MIEPSAKQRIVWMKLLMDTVSPAKHMKVKLQGEGSNRRPLRITRTLITNAHYAAFIQATGHRSLNVDRQTWQGYGLVHRYNRTRRNAWRAKTPPLWREF